MIKSVGCLAQSGQFTNGERRVGTVDARGPQPVQISVLGLTDFLRFPLAWTAGVPAGGFWIWASVSIGGMAESKSVSWVNGKIEVPYGYVVGTRVNWVHDDIYFLFSREGAIGAEVGTDYVESFSLLSGERDLHDSS